MKKGKHAEIGVKKKQEGVLSLRAKDFKHKWNPEVDEKHEDNMCTIML